MLILGTGQGEVHIKGGCSSRRNCLGSTIVHLYSSLLLKRWTQICSDSSMICREMNKVAPNMSKMNSIVKRWFMIFEYGSFIFFIDAKLRTIYALRNPHL